MIYAELKGVNFRPESARAIVRDLSVGDELTLSRDPDNEHDSNAIRVIDPSTDEFLGFVERGIAMDLAPRLDAGEEFDVRVYTRSGTIAVTLEIEEKAEDETTSGDSEPGPDAA